MRKAAARTSSPSSPAPLSQLATTSAQINRRLDTADYSLLPRLDGGPADALTQLQGVRPRALMVLPDALEQHCTSLA
jgi:hypothetical protein